MKSPKSVLFWVGNIWNHFPKRAWHLPTIIPLCNLKYIISLFVPSIWSAALLYPCSHSSGNKEISHPFQDWTKTAVPRSTSPGSKYPAIYNVQRQPVTISKRQKKESQKSSFFLNFGHVMVNQSVSVRLDLQSSPRGHRNSFIFAWRPKLK